MRNPVEIASFNTKKGGSMHAFRRLAAILTVSFLCLFADVNSPAFADGTSGSNSHGSPITCLSTNCARPRTSLKATVVVRKQGGNEFFRTTIDTSLITGEYSMALPFNGFATGTYTVTISNASGRVAVYDPNAGEKYKRITKKDLLVVPSSFVVQEGAASPPIKLLMPLTAVQPH